MGSSPAAATQLPESTTGAQRYLSIAAASIYVRDQERSLRFFRDQLGFRVAFDAQIQSGDRWVTVAPPDGSAVLSLIEPRPDTPEYKWIGRPTGVMIVTEDVAATYQEWRKRGVRFRYTPRLRRVKYAGSDSANPSIWGGVFTRFMDVDG